MKSNILTETGALTSSELDLCRRYVEQTESAVVEATQGLSEAQLRFKPAPDRWSIAEILEHTVIVQDYILGPVRERLAEAPAVSGNRDYKTVEDIVFHQFPLRSMRFPVPEPLQPTGRWTPSVALERLIANGGKLREYVESAPDLRLRTIESGPLKAITKGELDQMDGYQWALTAAAHTERHIGQILEVKADPAFPS